MSSKYHIVYSGQTDNLVVVEICEGLEYELSDYRVASRNSFDTEKEADDYAVDLALKYRLKFRSSSRTSYLD